MPNPKSTHISSIRQSHPEAFAKYVDIVVEDCTDTVEVDDRGIFITLHDEDHPMYDRIMKWDDERQEWDLWPPVDATPP